MATPKPNFVKIVVKLVCFKALPNIEIFGGCLKCFFNDALLHEVVPFTFKVHGDD